MASSKKKPLVLPDRSRCQAEIREGGSFMQLGKHAFQRCANKPAVIIREVQPGQDGRKGSMSLCASCLVVFKQKRPNWKTAFAFKPIA